MNDEVSNSMLKKIYDGVNKAGDSIGRVCKKTERVPGRIPEITVSLLYIILHIAISFFHEPWFDEAVAWQIAKCASIKDIIFKLPHYEGHPPLWHLLLLPFAKLGCPYEFSLSLVSLLFAGAAMLLVIWKSPFPRIIRLLLPFTYFFFYQYGIVSRPYCVMMLAFVLAAITFKDKDEKPWRFIFSLILLCFSTAYGILFAGGITIAWLLGLLKRDGFRFLLNKRRTLALFCLLLTAVLLVMEIVPASDAYAQMAPQYSENRNSPFLCLAYTFFALPSDTCATNIFAENNKLLFAYLDWIDILPGMIIGIFIWSALIYFARKCNCLLGLILPYGMFAVFAALKYMDMHHIGIVLLFFVFWAWCAAEMYDAAPINGTVFSLARIGGVIFMIISLFWGISASVREINSVYGIGKKEAEFIAENHLDDFRIAVGFDAIYSRDGENGSAEIAGYDLNHCKFTDGVLAYFDRNIFVNLNNGRDDMAFTYHKVLRPEDAPELIEELNSCGLPDVLFMPKNIEVIYKKIYNDDISYIPVFYNTAEHIWKSGVSSEMLSDIYVRTDLAEELGLKGAIPQ